MTRVWSMASQRSYSDQDCAQIENTIVYVCADPPPPRTPYQQSAPVPTLNALMPLPPDNDRYRQNLFSNFVFKSIKHEQWLRGVPFERNPFGDLSIRKSFGDVNWFNINWYVFRANTSRKRCLRWKPKRFWWPNRQTDWRNGWQSYGFEVWGELRFVCCLVNHLLNTRIVVATVYYNSIASLIVLVKGMNYR